VCGIHLLIVAAVCDRSPLSPVTDRRYKIRAQQYNRKATEKKEICLTT
jgi:hypothetical protein